MKPRFLVGCFVILAFVLGSSDQQSLAAGPQEEPTLPQAGSIAATYHGGLVTPPLPKPKFTLTDTSGAPFDFWSQTQKYVTLLFFGYTYCPDECPLQMANIASSLQELSPEVREQVKVVFVTTDPARDSAPKLRAWLDQFDRRFIGLTGSEAATIAAQRAALIPPANLGEVVGHFARIGSPEADIRLILDPLPFVRVALDEELAFIAGLMLPATRQAGLSFGDRACLALANKLGVQALTADRAWQRIGRAVGVEIELIRGDPH
jgi:protein SCO1